jgi:hypothetical protein
MKTLADLLLERLSLDPLRVAQRASRRYGKKEKYGKWLTAKKGEHIPLKKYRSRQADSVFNRYDRVASKIVGRNDLFSPSRDVQKAARDKVEDRFQSRSFDISDLHPTQPFVRTDDMETWKSKIGEKAPEHIRVVTHKGKHYVVDGHHSVVAARLRGEKTIEVKHLDMDEYK